MVVRETNAGPGRGGPGPAVGRRGGWPSADQPSLAVQSGPAEQMQGGAKQMQPLG